MEKKRVVLVSFVFLMLVTNLFIFLNSNITGSVIGEGNNFSFYFIVFIGQVFLMSLLMAVAAVVDKNEEKKEVRATTDIDILYFMLKKNRILKLAAISKIFNVNKRLALEWASILEEHNMAKIRYHTFRDTEILSPDYEEFIKKQKELLKMQKHGVKPVQPPVTASTTLQQVKPILAQQLPAQQPTHPQQLTGKPLQTQQAITQKPLQAQAIKTPEAQKVQPQLSQQMQLSQVPVQQKKEAVKKNKIVAALLSFFLGMLGIDRFYLGYIVSGIFKLLTAGGFGVWYIVDFILIIAGVLGPRGGVYAKRQKN